MKRLVWLLLAVFVTALAQVTPVELSSLNSQQHSCCETPGGCGNRDCGMPPAARTSSSTLVAEQPGQTVSTTARKNTARIYRLAISYLLQRRELSPVWNSRASHVVSVGSVPLFKAQCSFLI